MRARRIAEIAVLVLSGLSNPAGAKAYNLTLRREVSLPQGQVHRELRWESGAAPHGTYLVRAKDGGWTGSSPGWEATQRHSYRRAGPARGRSRRLSPSESGTTWALFAAGALARPRRVMALGREGSPLNDYGNTRRLRR